MIHQAKLTYSTFEKAFENQTKVIEASAKNQTKKSIENRVKREANPGHRSKINHD